MDAKTVTFNLMEEDDSDEILPKEDWKHIPYHVRITEHPRRKEVLRRREHARNMQGRTSIELEEIKDCWRRGWKKREIKQEFRISSQVLQNLIALWEIQDARKQQ